jgi:hypothetical protein
MQIKLPENVAKKFEGKSPEEIIAVLSNHQFPATTPAAPEAPPANVVSLADFQALLTRVDAVESSGKGFATVEAVAAVDAKIATVETKLTGVATEAATEASKAVAKALAGTGIAAPIGGGATDQSASQPATNKGQAFTDAAAKHLAGGKTKMQAIEAAIKEQPEAYTEWLKGGSGKL